MRVKLVGSEGGRAEFFLLTTQVVSTMTFLPVIDEPTVFNS